MALVSAQENAARLQPFQQPLAGRQPGGYDWNQQAPPRPPGVRLGVPQGGPMTAMQARPLPGTEGEMPMSARPPGQPPAAPQVMGRRRAISDLMRRRPIVY